MAYGLVFHLTMGCENVLLLKDKLTICGIRGHSRSVCRKTSSGPSVVELGVEDICTYCVHCCTNNHNMVSCRCLHPLGTLRQAHIFAPIARNLPISMRSVGPYNTRIGGAWRSKKPHLPLLPTVPNEAISPVKATVPSNVIESITSMQSSGALAPCHQPALKCCTLSYINLRFFENITI